MAKRKFRYDKATDSMVEVPLSEDFEPSVGIHGDIQPFISPRDGTVITSRAHMRDYMAKHNLVHFDPTMKREEDRYQKDRDDQALREQLYERVDKLVRDPTVRRYIRTRR
jgi:hypothetical protein